MGTRSIIILQDASEQPATEIAVLYRQHDGYPTGLGADIKGCLGGKKVVNGYNALDQINGPGDMCVQLIATLKWRDCEEVEGIRDTLPLNSPGSLYLNPPGTRDMGEEYTYTLSCAAGKPIHLTVSDGNVLYDGSLDEFDPKACESSEEEG